MEDYVTAAFSGGKDSTAMVLHMIDLGEHIDEVINTDTGVEFPEMYEHIERVRQIVEAHGIKFTTLKADHSFEWYLLERPVSGARYGMPDHTGLGWPTMRTRWCTRFLKDDLITAYYRELSKTHRIIRCIGLAADEVDRLERGRNKDPDHRHPLAEWGWTEADALHYCYDRGFDWGGLYRIFGRVSCWCCPLRNLKDLRALWRDRPDEWRRLVDLDDLALQTEVGARNRYKRGKSAREYAQRFEREAKAEEEQTDLGQWGVKP